MKEKTFFGILEIKNYGTKELSYCFDIQGFASNNDLPTAIH